MIQFLLLPFFSSCEVFYIFWIKMGWCYHRVTVVIVYLIYLAPPPQSAPRPVWAKSREAPQAAESIRKQQRAHEPTRKVA